MCGIAGYVLADSLEPCDARIVRAMCDTMVHRGPDDSGIYTDGPAGIGMRRLSVIALSTGHQPISNETKSIWIVFNGEIYNYRELAQWLVARGHHLYTSSDTEVIVHLYEEFGSDCIQKLRGMFAFAIWDRSRSRLFIARDRLGVKPLYYFWDERRLVFGSELKAILAHPGVSTQMDPQGLLYYMRYSYIPDPLTIFKNISKLPPGHFLELTGGTLSIQPYWDGVAPPDSTDPSPSEDEAIVRLEGLLQESVRLRLVSDVPLGAFLSGGVDSSVVVALMAREMARPVTTFSIGFEEEAYNELPFARQAAQYLGTDHHELIVGPQDCRLIERLVTHFDEPFGDPSAIPMYYVSQLAAQHVTVALSGDGGDELFAGYDRYRVELDRMRFDGLPGAVRGLLDGASEHLPDGFYGKNWLHSISLPPRQRYLESVSYISPRKFGEFLSQEFMGQVSGDRDGYRLLARYYEKVEKQPWLAQLQYLDAKSYLPGDVMTKVDRMSMAHSLEAREPLLDHLLVEYVAGLPIHYKYRNGVTKYLFKRVAERLLPAEIVHRKKQGFGVPLEYWFTKELKAFIRDILFSAAARQRGIFQPKAVANIVDLYEGGRKELATTIWILVIFEQWCRLYLDQPCQFLEREKDSGVLAGPKAAI